MHIFEVYLEHWISHDSFVELLNTKVEAKDKEEAIHKWAYIHEASICQSQYDYENNTGEWNWLGDGIEVRLIK